MITFKKLHQFNNQLKIFILNIMNITNINKNEKKKSKTTWKMLSL